MSQRPSRWRTAPRFSRRLSFLPPPVRPSPTPRALQRRKPAMNADELRGLFDLSGRTVIITGGTRGIGFALAQGHLVAAANVVVTGRSEERCRAAREALDAPGRVAAVAAHMGDLDD